MNEEEEFDAGFELSVKLMMLGILMLLAILMGVNKLFLYYSRIFGFDNSTGFFEIENASFLMRSYTELYFTWVITLITLFALIHIIFRLIKSWND